MFCKKDGSLLKFTGFVPTKNREADGNYSIYGIRGTDTKIKLYSSPDKEKVIRMMIEIQKLIEEEERVLVFPEN